MTTNPSSTTKYIGIAVTNSATAPAYGSFTWSKYIGDDGSRGPQGPQGVQGPAGANGQPTYTWVKYANDKNGGGMSDYPEGKRFIGLAFNKTTQTESTTPSHYQWSEMPQNIEIGGRNLILNSAELEASGLGSVSGSRAEYRTIDVGQSYMHLEDGTEVTLSFDLEMSVATANPSIMVYNTNRPGPVQINGKTIYLNGNVGSVINERVSVTTTVKINDPATYDYNTIEFYSNYGTDNFFRVSNLKLERGNIATDWTEAPEDTQARIDEKADTDLIDNIQTQLDGFVSSEDYDPQIGAINIALQEYRELIESGEVATDEAVGDIKKLLDRTEAVENNLGQFTESWNFEVTEITMGEEGLFLGDNITNMGIRIAPQVGDTPPRIDFVDNGTVVAEITGQYMRINRGIFVESATIGEHKIETIAGGHTIWSWIPSTP